MLLAITALGILFIPVAVAPGESTDLLTDMFLKVVAIFILMINLIDTRERLKVDSEAGRHLRHYPRLFRLHRLRPGQVFC